MPASVVGEIVPFVNSARYRPSSAAVIRNAVSSPSMKTVTPADQFEGMATAHDGPVLP